MKKAEEILDKIYNLEKHKTTNFPIFSQLELITDCIKEAQKDAIKATIKMAANKAKIKQGYLFEVDRKSITDCEDELLKLIE